MSEKVQIQRNCRDIDVPPKLRPYTKVIVTAGTGENQSVYTAGYDGGAVMELSIPWATQRIANHIFAELRGFRYQPFSLSGVRLDPARRLVWPSRRHRSRLKTARCARFARTPA